MAYMSQEHKKVIAAKLKEFMPKDWKYSLSVHNHSEIVCVIKSAPFELKNVLSEKAAEHAQNGNFSVNPHVCWAKEQFVNEDVKNVVLQMLQALNHNNHNNSDIMTDYFDVGHYVSLKFGRWDKPFINTSK